MPDIPYYSINASDIVTDSETISITIDFEATSVLDQSTRDALVTGLADALGDLPIVASVNSVIETTATNRAVN